MRIEQTFIQKVKIGVHIAQLVFIFIGGCLSLAVLTEKGKTGGEVGFYFALCFLSLPALVYQTMVPMWTRAWKFANVYAYAAIDILMAILWFAAAIAVAVWAGEGTKSPGNKNDKRRVSHSGNNGQHSCSNGFKFGSETKCVTTKVGAAFGVFIFLLWGMTAAISIYGVFQFKRTGIMPNGNSMKHGQVEQLPVDDPKDNAWSANTDELDPNHPSSRYSNDAGLGIDQDPRRAYGQLPQEEDASLLANEDPFHDSHGMRDTHTSEGAHPGRPLSYQSSTNLSISAPPSYHEEGPPAHVTQLSPTGYVAPSALSPTDYEQTPGGRYNFPQGNYGADFR